MFVIIVLCIIIYLGAYCCLKSSGQSTKVKPMRSFDDFFM
ncbi:hypothetical protein HNQ41_000664 [Texcoconibacillus texcoconensis]|uniref:Uncharacterized protein n=1 Tax=Texcoconibacillus texcoconensis TaxID=1095777 RepID=A0A840QMG2_9BACI|nr:hypothetical protein [Texcoconibacillus texcoconensis]